MINRIILIGYLGQDPEFRILENGAHLVKFSMSTHESYKDQTGEWKKVTQWHPIIMWRAMADHAFETLRKGSMIYLEGKLTHRQWEDADGFRHRISEVVANYFRRIGGRHVNDDVDADHAGEPEPEKIVIPPAPDDDLPF